MAVCPVPQESIVDESRVAANPNQSPRVTGGLLASVIGFGAVLLAGGTAWANSPGLPFVEAFGDQDLRDPATTADWNTVAAQLTLQTAPVSGSPSLDSSTVGVASPETRNTRGVALADIDGDGDLDAVKGAQGQNYYYLNDGTGNFTESPLGSDLANTRAIAVADFDGDGSLDVAAANYGSDLNRLYLNNGTSDPFAGVDATDIGTEAGLTDTIVAADVNGDGAIDLVIGNHNRRNRVYLNTGTSRPFENVAPRNLGDGGDTSWITENVSAGDVNNDGLIDIVIANGNDAEPTLSAPGVFVYLNGGNPANPFDAPGLLVGAPNSEYFDPQATALADFNGDGWLDIVLADARNEANQIGETLIYFNAAPGDPATNPFSNPGVQAAPGGAALASQDVAVADLDLDGDVDFVVANKDIFSTPPGEINQVYFNDGTGSFSVADLGANLETTDVVALGDLDGDGDIDVLAGNDDRGPNAGVDYVYFNAIAGTPTPNPAALQLTGRGLSIQVNDPTDPNEPPLSGTASIETIALSVTDSTPAHTRIEYWLSNNGGSTWFLVGPDRSFRFPTTGTDLRWRADLSTLSPANQPSVDTINLSLAPTANPDSITVDEGGTATVLDSAATSVLANDTDPAATGFAEAVLIEDVRAGTLLLNIDGTFSYMHDGTNVLEDSFRYAYDNGTTVSDAVTVSINVNNVNDAPALVAAIGDQTFDEGESVSLDISGNFDDADGDPLTFSASGLPPSGNLTISPEGVITGTPDQADVDDSPYTVVVTATDGDLAADGTFVLSIVNVNDAPLVVAPIGDVTVDQGEAVNLDVSANFSDPDGDTLSFSASGLPGSGNLGISTAGVISGTPTQADVVGSPYTVIVTADDGNGGTIDDTFTLTVLNVNDVPVLVTPIGDQTASEDTAFGLDVSGNFDDADGDTLTFTATGLPASLTLDPSGTFMGTPTQTDVNNSPFAVTVNVADGNGGSVSDSFSLSILNVNDAPVVSTPIGPRSATEGIAFTLDVSGGFQDADGDTLSFSATGLPGSFGISPAGIVSGTPTQADVNGSPYNVTVTANDGNGGITDDSFALTIVNVNDDPRLISPVGSRTYDQNEAVSLDLSTFFTDDDGDTLSYTATGLPPGLTLSASGTISGTLGQPDVEGSPYDVTVTASDGQGGTPAEDQFVITVNNVNDAPVLNSPIPDQTVVANEPVSIDLSGSFSDPDGDAITYSAAGLPTGLAINATGQISGTVNIAAQQGSPYTVALTATDDPGESASADFQLIVADPADADLGIAITVAPSPAVTGDQAAWTVTVSNAGPAVATGVLAVVEWSGAELTFATPPAGCTVDSVADPATASCTVSDLAPDGSATLEFMVTHGAPGSAVATASVTADNTDLDAADNQARAALSVADEFTAGPAYTLGSATALAAAAGDVDGDGDIDIVVGTAAGEPALLFRNDGTDGFTETGEALPTSSETKTALLDDLDLDGDLDLVFAGGGEVSTWANDGNGSYSRIESLPIGGLVTAAIGDIDGDGITDVVAGASPQSFILLNDGTGNLSIGGTIASAGVTDLAVGFLDGNAFADVLITLEGADSLVLLDDGSANAPDTRITRPFADGGSLSAAIGDLATDGTADDAVLASSLVLYRGSGTGGFSAGESIGVGVYIDLAIADLDEQGNNDIIALTDGDAVQIWLADGQGGFALDGTQLSTPDAVSVLAARINDDEHVDLVVSNSTSGGVDVFLNDGRGRLGEGDVTPPTITLNGSSVVTISAGQTFNDPGATATDDVDGDLTADITVTGSVGTTPGDYELVYSVSDSAGNSASVTRTVRVTATSSGGGGGGGALSWWLLAVLAGTALWPVVRRLPRREGLSG